MAGATDGSCFATNCWLRAGWMEPDRKTFAKGLRMPSSSFSVGDSVYPTSAACDFFAGLGWIYPVEGFSVSVFFPMLRGVSTLALLGWRLRLSGAGYP